MKKNYYVYVYLDPRKKYNEKHFNLEYLPIYVGKGKGNRHLDHIKYLEKDWNYTNKQFKEKLNDLINNDVEPIIIKLYENLTENDAFNKEYDVINKIGRICENGPLYNITNGGNGTSGYKYSEERLKIAKKEYGKRFGDHSGENHYLYGKSLPDETKDKISKAHKNLPKEYLSNIHKRLGDQSGINHPMYGKKHTKESIKKMSEAQMGKVHSEETKAKMSEAQRGKKLSDEHKEKLSKAHKGKKLSDEHKEKLSKARMGKKPWNYGKSKEILQYDLDNNFIKKWDNLIGIEKEGFQKSNIISVCNGKRKTHKGFIWKYGNLDN